ncbi:MAG: DUF6599 family protein [Chthonomonadales bacterium]
MHRSIFKLGFLAAASAALVISTVAARADGAASVLPKAGSMPGWKQIGATKMYNPTNLFDLLDGEAESIKQYSFVACAHAEYAPSAANKPVMTIDVFDMTDALNSYGLFSSERSSGKAIAIGAEGVNIPPSGLNFWKGRYVVRTTIVKVSPANQAAQLAVARSIASKITGAGTPPASVGALPPGKQPRSEKYVRANVVGQSFLKNAITARYPSAGTGAELFVCEFPSASGAKAAFAAYQSYEKSGTGLVPVKGLGESSFEVKDKYAKNVCVAQKGKYVVGIVRAKDAPSAQALVKKAISKVK